MAIFPEILVGASVARVVIADRFPHQRVEVRGDGPLPRTPHSLIGMIAEQHSDQWRVVCMALPEGINVCAYGRWGFPVNEWGSDHGHKMVSYPSTPLTEDQAGFRTALAEVLLPVVESALDAIQAERDSVTTPGGYR